MKVFGLGFETGVHGSLATLPAHLSPGVTPFLAPAQGYSAYVTVFYVISATVLVQLGLTAWIAVVLKKDENAGPWIRRWAVLHVCLGPGGCMAAGRRPVRESIAAEWLCSSEFDGPSLMACQVGHSNGVNVRWCRHAKQGQLHP